MKRIVAMLFLSAMTATVEAHAQPDDPSVWARAAQPSLATDASVLAQVDSYMSELVHLRRSRQMRPKKLLLHNALRLLERHASGSNDPRLRLRLALVYYRLFDVDKEATLLDKAVPHFEFVAASTAPVAMRTEALKNAAICFARLGKHKKETETYDRALAIDPDPETRAVLLSNQAEGFMAMGQIVRAVRGYRSSLHDMPGAMRGEEGVSAMWGLAVGLDRSGDLRAAIEQVTQARAYDRYDRAINNPGWFYVPWYDRYWYSALGYWQTARKSTNLDVQLAAYQAAAAAFGVYIREAPESDPWRALAATRLNQCEREKRQLATGRRGPRTKRALKAGKLNYPPLRH
jgi:tetratricopeptide (TPR) repeat protein